MMSSELISIIIPVYNVSEYLDRCMDSVVNQTYKNLEIILVDDGSNDDTGVMCDKWKERDNRIVVVHKENGGLSDARNAGIDVAKGQYIGFVDGDDYIERDMYEVLLQHAINVDVVTSGIFDEYDDRQIAINCSYKNDGRILNSQEAVFLFLDEKSGGNVSSCCKLWSKHLFEVERYSVGKAYEDLDLLWRMLKRNLNVCHVNKPLYHYCHRDNSITTMPINDKLFDLVMYADMILADAKLSMRFCLKQACTYWVSKYIYVLSKLYDFCEGKRYTEKRVSMEINLRKNLLIIITSPISLWSKLVAIGAAFHKGERTIAFLNCLGRKLRKEEP